MRSRSATVLGASKVVLGSTLTLALALATLTISCASPIIGASGDGGSDVGAMSLALTVAPGIALGSATYTISATDFKHTATVTFSAAMAEATIDGLPAGAGYGVTVHGTPGAGGGGTSCSGSASFAITTGATTLVSIDLTCDGPPRRGGVVDGGIVNLCPSVDGISANPGTAMVGKTIELSGAGHDPDGGPAPLALTWSATAGTISNPAASNPTFTCSAAGPATITMSVTDGDCVDSQSVVVTCTPLATPKAIVVINEIESSGGVPGDWVELYNAGNAPADLSAFIFRDNDDTHGYPIPAGTTLAAGAYLVLEEAAIGFGLGAADAARLYDATGTTLVDSYSWTSHALTTYGRCPNGVGAFATTAASTKGAANSCSTGVGTDGGVALSAWPGANAVAIVDQAQQFSGNLSGLSYDPATSAGPAVLWAVQNSPSTLYRLLWNGTTWASTTTDSWSAGKQLHYPDGSGTPDSEGVTKAEAASTAIYVSTERNADAGSVSRLSVLRFDTSAPGSALTATNEWNLTGDLPVADANLGLEAITWIPDSFLVGAGFVDESTNQPYAPSRYANHGTGIFFVGLEANGTIYGFALDHVGGGFQRIATFAGGQASIMDLSFDRDVGYLWGYCDNTCANRAAVLMIDTDPLSATHGHFRLSRLYDHPSTLPDVNNEGIAIAPESECAGGRKAFFWSDDSATGGYSLRRDSIPCGQF